VFGDAVKAWNTCGAHKAPQPSTAELIERSQAIQGLLATARKWLDDLQAGRLVDVEHVTGGLEGFEQLAL